MFSKMNRLRILFLTLFLPLFIWAEDPSALYLSWVKDPSTSMVIQWLQEGAVAEKTAISYQKEGDSKWKEMSGSSQQIPRSELFVHTIELTQLREMTIYRFKIGQEGRIYRFRTMPKDVRQGIRFVVGGDAYYDAKKFRAMNRQIARTNPDFIVLGGDIAYTEGVSGWFHTRSWKLNRWRTFFEEWKKAMVTRDGRLIPIVPVIGNHDVKDNKPAFSNEEWQLFYLFFAFPEKGTPFRAMDFGSYLSLTLLDTGHTYPINGGQLEWLKDTLNKHDHFLYNIAVYHIAGYPSVYSYEGQRPTAIRKYWAPLFEKHHLQVAFENHNHAYKRTPAIKAEALDPEGVTYLGDGCWGVNARTSIPPSKAWYLASSRKANCFWLVDLYKEEMSCRSVNIMGEEMEEVQFSPRSDLIGSALD